jgi:1,3-beta-glucanosyltransferase GAS1
MMDSLSCTVSSKIDEEDYGALFGTVCGFADGKYCAGINKNTTVGGYGAYGMCNSTEQLGFALNAYASANPNGGCDFSGSATSKQAVKTASSSCTSLMKQAGSEGTGTVTASPVTNTGAATGSSTAGAASGLTVPGFNTGFLSVGVYIVGAVLSGAAMIIL